MSTSKIGIACSVLLAGLPAQQKFVSPITAATVDGVSQNRAPFGDGIPRRYMQIHSDLGTTPRQVTKIAFRRNASEPNGTGTSSFDLELWCGPTVPYDRASFAFGANWLQTPSRVIARKTLNFGPFTSTSNPPAFELGLAFDAAFSHSGTQSFGWELVVHSNTVSGTFPGLFDADSGSTAVPPTPASGSGCVVTGQSAAMSHVLTAGDAYGTLQLGGYVTNAPPASGTFLALGVTDPDLAVGGLCSNLRTDLTAVIPLGNTDANGFLGGTAAGVKLPASPFAFLFANTFAGLPLYTQVHSLDAGSSWAVKVANSEGRAVVVPAPNLVRGVRVTRLFNSDGGTLAQHSLFFAGSSVGYGLVTEFTY